MNYFPFHLNQRLTFYQKDLSMLYAVVLAGTLRLIASCKLSFLPSTVNWSFLRIFLIAETNFNSIKTNNRFEIGPHQSPCWTQFRSQGLNVFLKSRDFFRKPWSPWVQDLVRKRINARMSGNCGGFNYSFYRGLSFSYSVRTSFVSFWSILADECFF